MATSMDGSTERIIQYLQGYGININVLFFNVFEHQGKRLLSRTWMFDLDDGGKQPEKVSRNWNGECYFSFGVDAQRSWKDAEKYGFVSAEGGAWYTRTMRNLAPGNRILVNIPHVGYTGVGIVAEEAKSAKETAISVDGKDTSFFELPLDAQYSKDVPVEKEEYVAKVE